MNESFKKIFIMSWNVRGLGDPDKYTIARDVISDAFPTIVCLKALFRLRLEISICYCSTFVCI